MRRTRSRAAVAREARRAQMFARFRHTELNLVPLVDTFVSIVFFALTAAAVGELMPVARGVTLPRSRVGNTAVQQLTVGVTPAAVTFGGQPVAEGGEGDAAAAARGETMPALAATLRAAADSVRARRGLAAGAPVPVPLAIHGDRLVRYARLARVMRTARAAGFQEISLQVERVEGAAP